MANVMKSALSSFCETAEELGVDPIKILRKQGLRDNYLKNIGVSDTIEFGAANNLLRALAHESGQEHCGALMGSKQDIGFLGILGYLILQCDNVGSALQALVKYLSVHLEKDAAVSAIHNYGENSSLCYIHTLLPLERQSYANELAIAQGMIIMRALCGNYFKAKAVHFSHAAPVDVLPYKNIFKAPVYFSQDHSEIIFATSLLHQPIVETDPLLREILINQIEHLEQLHPDSKAGIKTQLEHFIRRSLQSQRYSIGHAAKHLSLHPRTLQRKLDEENISYSGMLEKIRKEVAIERLQNSDISIIQLADYLGYGDNTAFTRAFKRWFGDSPSRWRKKHTRSF